jgi:hypothetical protein
MMFMLTWVIMLLYKMRYVMTFLCARVIMLFYMNVYMWPSKGTVKYGHIRQVVT